MGLLSPVGICLFNLRVPKLPLGTLTCAQEDLSEERWMTSPHPDLCGDIELGVSSLNSSYTLKKCHEGRWNIGVRLRATPVISYPSRERWDVAWSPLYSVSFARLNAEHPDLKELLKDDIAHQNKTTLKKWQCPILAFSSLSISALQMFLSFLRQQLDVFFYSCLQESHPWSRVPDHERGHPSSNTG